MSISKSKLIIIILPILVALFSLEIGIRIIKSYMLNKPIFEKYKEIFSNERNTDYVFWHKPNVEVFLERGENSYTFISNKYGHRSETDNIKFDKSIVFLGDSIIEGATVENNETISSRVAKLLNFPTINLGLAASNTVQEYFLVKNKFMESFGMKLLILGFCVNDIAQNVYRRAFNPEIGNWEYFDTVIVDPETTKHFFSLTPQKKLNLIDYIKKSEAIVFLYHNVYIPLGMPKVSKNNKKNKGTEETFNNIYTENEWLNTEYFINKISNFVSSKEADFVVIIFPTKEQVNGKVVFSHQKKLKEILKSNNILYYDPLEDLIKYKKTLGKEISLFGDNIHPNKLGTEIISKLLTKYLKKQNYKYLNNL